MIDLGGEIRIDTIQLGDYPLRIIGPVQGPTLLQPLAEKVATGEGKYADDLLLSSWIISNLRGGFGVAIIDPQTQADRYRFGTAWVLQDRQNQLPAQPFEVVTGVPAHTELRVAVTWNNAEYFVCDTKVRLLNTDATALLTPVEAGYTDLTANGVDGISIYLAGTQWLVLSDANGYLQFN